MPNTMTAQDAARHVQEYIAPRLNELGMEAFVITGYLRDGEGKVQRVTFGTSGGNAAYDDGLRPMQVMSARWGTGQL
jgi:hypothetical protein